jgi:hypothetical protein
MRNRFLLLLMGFRVPVHVEPSHLLWGKHGLKVVSELLDRKLFQQSTLAILSVEHVLVGADFLRPETAEFFVGVQVSFRVLSVHRVAYFIKVLVSNGKCSLKHDLKLPVQACLDVRAAFRRGLNQEPSADDIAFAAVSGPNNIPELFLCAQLIPDWFGDELQSNFVEQLRPCVLGLWTELVISHQHRIVIAWVFNFEIKTVVIAIKLNTPHS